MWQLIEPALKLHAHSFNRWVIGLSGGQDSVALLHVLVKNGIAPSRLLAVYVNHRVHPHSKQWGLFCKQYCQQLQVPFETSSVYIRSDQSGNMEEKCRIARYKILKRHADLKKGCVLVAHHLGDQVETFFLNALRGSGGKGLSGMQISSIHFGFTLLRPMLTVSPDQIQAYVKKHGLAYINDPSNQDTALRRNYVRQKLLPVIKNVWPNYSQSIAKTMSCLDSDAKFNGQLMDYVANKSGMVKILPQLIKFYLNRFPPEQIKEIYRYIYHYVNQQGWVPAPRWVEQQLQENILPRGGCVFWSNLCLMRFVDMLWIYPVPELPVFKKPIEWKNKDQIQAIGWFDKKWSQSNRALMPDLFETGALEIRFEHFAPQKEMGRKSFKKIMQFQQIPPFLRPYVPLLYVGENLIAIGDFWINPLYTQKEGIALEWHWYYER